MHKHHTFAGLLSGLTAASIWGGMYVVSKVVLESDIGGLSLP